MARTLSEVIGDLPRDQQQDIAARAAQLIEDEMTLRDRRKAHELTKPKRRGRKPGAERVLT
jgi:hypothetical protein